MFVADDRVIYSASDLAAAARCEFALLRSFDAYLGRGPAIADQDELLARTAQLGADHELRHLDELRLNTADQVTIIGRPSFTVASLTAAAEATRRAVASKEPLIYQAAMFDGRFVGFADFLILENTRYRLRDSKLAHSVKVEALLQLAAYADTLRQNEIPVHDEVELILGDGTIAEYRVDDITPVYRSRRVALERLLDEHLDGGTAASWADHHVRACMRCPECITQVQASDDLLLVAGMRASQRARLLTAGVATMHQLAQHNGAVPGLATRSLNALRGQARLQTGERIDGKPPYEIIDPQALEVLPDPDRGDLFFDFEGDPMWGAGGRDWGLEYLFGVLGATPIGGGRPGNFSPLWAHDRKQERQAFLNFLKLVSKRRKRFPNMHVYHYAPYEKTALLRLAGRYGVGEEDVDELLREGILVDLYPLVRKSIRIGTANYSLKSLEPLYMGAHLRAGEVTTATDSITMYARYCSLIAAGREAEATVVLKEIEDYNHYDCLSTQRLRDWLIGRAIEAVVIPLGPQQFPETQSAATELPDELGARLTEVAGVDPATRTPEQQAVAMLAAARGFHRREDKPFWWSHFDRLANPVDEWSDCAGVFVADNAEVAEDWHTPPKARKPQRRVRLHGRIAAGELCRRMYALYEPPAPAGLADDPLRRAAGSAEVSGCDDPDAPTEVVIIEREPKSGTTFHQLPFALTPGPPISNAILRESIDATARLMAAGLPALPQNAMTDVLLRRAPRMLSGTSVRHTGAAAADITMSLLDLDSSYIAVHGPPGTGKTFTAARVLSVLITEHRWRIGVVAQSHAAVENLLCDVIATGVPADRVAKKKHGVCRGWRELDEKEYPAFIDAGPGCVIGGTSWDFANQQRVPRESLDLLVIEEAGQYCLANTIAVASAARNLLLLGDPQQLPQVTQGTHPEPIDSSALGWLVGGRQTLPEEFGYFLDRSYRMHPAVCAAVSRLSYDKRLSSEESVTAARCLSGIAPGVQVRKVQHFGNDTDSPEEAEAIVSEIGLLLGCRWTDEHGTRPLTQADILVVTPYNAQVTLLHQRFASAGLAGVQVGTVDKFQGRQAPVVFLSMVASSMDDVPRGMAFLLNRNRLNVAISRAKYAAIIVHAARLTDHLPAGPAALVDLGAFLALESG